MKSLVTFNLLALLALGSHGLNFLDCAGNDDIWGFLRTCCTSPELPNGCECFDISSSSDFTNSQFHKPKCPEELGVVFTLFTCGSGAGCSAQIKAGQTNVRNSNFDPSVPTMFIAHGFTDNGQAPWVLGMKDELMILGKHNVITVDWRNGAKAPNYPQATANTRTVGAMIGRLAYDFYRYQGAAPESFHLIGHSLGAQIMGYAGKEFERQAGVKLGRISGLDPAGPNFESYSANVRVDASDAQFVDIMHTDAETVLESGFGTRYSIGHVDFYPNGGQHQPGCPPETYGILSMLSFEDEKSTGACSHGRAVDLFSNSINKCRYNPPTGGDYCTMGFHTNVGCRGDHYPKTGSVEPFC